MLAPLLGMKSSLLALVVLVALPSVGCVAGALPPSRSEIGTTMHRANGEVATGMRVASGAHLASASLGQRPDYDIGIGYIYESVDDSGHDISDGPSHGGEGDSLARTSHGAYASFATLVSNNERENHRTWVGLRAEYLNSSDGEQSVGVLARGTWEVFGAVDGGGGFSDNCGGGAGYASGTAALGLYIEAGSRRNFDNEGSVSATAGVSLRLPFLFGFAYNLCGD